MHPARLFPSVLLAASLAAQNEFMIYPERNGSAATYTSRTANSVIEQFMEAPGTLVGGVGDDGTQCLVTGTFHWATDEDATTQETYHVVMRTPAAAGGPDASAAGLITRVGPLFLPVSSGRVGWLMNVSFAAPVVVPATGGFFHGVELNAANWTTDGHSIWDARYNPPSTRNIGDNPRLNAPRHAWANNAGFTAAYDWCWRMGVVVANPVLNVGGIDPANVRQQPPGSSNYGGGGLYPDVSGQPRSDGVDLRFEARTMGSGTALGFLATAPLPTPVAMAGIAGRLYLHPGFLILPIGSSSITGGLATVPVAPPAAVPATLLGATLYFQVLAVDPTFNLAWTNMAGVSF